MKTGLIRALFSFVQLVGSCFARGCVPCWGVAAPCWGVAGNFGQSCWKTADSGCCCATCWGVAAPCWKLLKISGNLAGNPQTVGVAARLAARLAGELLEISGNLAGNPQTVGVAARLAARLAGVLLRRAGSCWKFRAILLEIRRQWVLLRALPGSCCALLGSCCAVLGSCWKFRAILLEIRRQCCCAPCWACCWKLLKISGNFAGNLQTVGVAACLAGPCWKLLKISGNLAGKLQTVGVAARLAGPVAGSC